MSPDSVAVGDIMQTVNPEGFEPTEHEVTYSETKPQPCVEIITESGATLKCSTSAPILTSEGEQCDAAQLLGRFIPYKDGDKYEYTLVSEVRDIGEQLVQHITCGNQYFLAGGGNGLYLLHHNVKMQVDGARQNAIMRMDDNNNQFLQESNGFGGGATRGAMQANGTWDAAHGGTASNPATSFGQSQQAPLGQGIFDAFGQAGAPVNGSVPDSMSREWGGTGQSSLPAYNNSWYTNPQQSAQPVQPSMGNPAEAPYTGFKGFIRKATNAVDNKLLGNIYDENSDSFNAGNVAALGARLVPGGSLAAAGFNKYANGQLMKGNDGMGTDYARTQMQQQYDRTTDPSKRQSYVTDLATKYNMQPAQVLQIIGRGE